MSNGIYIHACIYILYPREFEIPVATGRIKILAYNYLFILYLIRAKDGYTTVNGGTVLVGTRVVVLVGACTSTCRYLYCSGTVLVLVHTWYCGTVRYKHMRVLGRWYSTGTVVQYL